MNKLTLKNIEAAWPDQGECRSCGWHAAWYEVEGSFSDDEISSTGEYWTPCKSEDEFASDHRGSFIYLEILK